VKLFQRKKNQTISDLENYYASRNNRASMAWLMAFLSLLATIVIIAGLFFGGRWLYRALSSNDSDERSVATLDTTVQENGTVGTGGSNDNNASTEQGGVVSDQAARTDVTETVTDTTEAERQSSAIPSDDDNLPETGAGDTMILLIVVTVFGYTAAQYVQSRR
jgi:predicted permease